MKKIILVAGATGNLGGRICRDLINKNAHVIAVVRASSDPEKMEDLLKAGVNVIKVDFNNIDEIAAACKGVNCVVSAVAGLREIVVDLQKNMLQGALQAGVTRFIPSDFCTDYNSLVPGGNRNFDLRREFKAYLDGTAIQASSIFNGAFADILKYNTPVLNLKNNSISYWGEKSEWKLDFTTMDNTSAFTAEVALDDDAPRNLHIASFQISPNRISAEVQQITCRHIIPHKIGSMEEFAQMIKKQRKDNPGGENELYAKWQQSQYVYSMFSTHHGTISNNRYPDLNWTTAAMYLKSFVK